MHVDTERNLNVLAMELSSRRGTWLALAIVVSLGLLITGAKLPKKFTSYASILVERQNIVGPLMEGVAEQTNVRDLASIVRELAFSRRLLEQIVQAGGWLEGNPSEFERELLMESIIKRTRINNRGGNLIDIEYTDETPERAFRITRMYVDWVLEESRDSRRRESMNVDGEQGGIRMRVQEPPVMPQAPSGMRFMHVALAGLFLSLAMPIGMSALIVQFDPRVRMKERIERLKLPVIAVIPEVSKERGFPVHWVKHLIFAFGVLVLIGIYAGAAWLKLNNHL